jgi:hypothetical protein
MNVGSKGGRGLRKKWEGEGEGKLIKEVKRRGVCIWGIGKGGG